MKIKLLIAMGAALLAAPALFAGELGQAAAPLKISEWTKGKAVDLAAAKGKQIVVVEFWATWCGPCRTSIPHLTELQKKFKDNDVIFVGVSDEKPDVVKKFVEKMGDKMDYVVAIDDARGTSKGYMQAFGINGIPHAFVVDKEGRIVWQGHPMAGLDAVLTEIVAGKFDLTKSKKRQQAQDYIEEFVKLVSEDQDVARQDKLAADIAAIEAETGTLDPERKFDPERIRKMVKFQTTLRKYQGLYASGADVAKLADLEKVLTETAPPDFDLAEHKESLTFTKSFAEYLKLATGSGDKDKMAALAKTIGETKISNAGLLNEFAWTLLTNEGIKHRDPALATKLAKAAVDASEGKEPAVLDTYAKALFDSGKTAEAIAQQKKAVALAEDEEMRKELQETLKQYEAKAAK